MPNPENIVEHKWKPGESGNPEGMKPGTRHLSTILKEMLNEEVEVDEEGKKVKRAFADEIVRKLVKKANSGDIKAIQEIFDRTEGKAKQEIDQLNRGDITIKVIRE